MEEKRKRVSERSLFPSLATSTYYHHKKQKKEKPSLVTN
jgi:hypothetical protein